MLSARAELERDLLIERTNAGIARAKAEGKHIGRPFALSDKQRVQVQQALVAGVPIAQIARDQDTAGRPSCGCVTVTGTGLWGRPIRPCG
jgi:putative DNA-invertase from lambdoid prophage Rac